MEKFYVKVEHLIQKINIHLTYIIYLKITLQKWFVKLLLFNVSLEKFVYLISKFFLISNFKNKKQEVYPDKHYALNPLALFFISINNPKNEILQSCWMNMHILIILFICYIEGFVLCKNK